MISAPIRSMNETGAWSSAYLSHHENAWHYHGEYINLIRELAEAEDAHRLRGTTCESLIQHLTDDLNTAAYRSATSTHLYACLAMEGFLNYYGVRRLGGQHFQDNILKLSISEKMKAIFHLCFGAPPSKKLIKAVQSTFQKRNKLVHPVTTEVNKSNYKSVTNPHPEDHYVNDTIETLTLFSKELCTLDKDLNMDFHFPRP